MRATPLTIDPLIATQQAKLLASDGKTYDAFGSSGAVSGDTAIISASGSGSAYVFVRSGTTWSQQAKLLASDGAARDLFGYSVAVSADTAIIGAYRYANISGLSRAAYVFVRSGTTWSEQARLLASQGDLLGASVALSGDTAIVGAPKNAFKADGIPCTSGVRAAGRCVAPSADAGLPDGRAGPDAAPDAPGPDAPLDTGQGATDTGGRAAPGDGGCDCEIGDRTAGGSSWLWLLLGLWLVQRRRSRTAFAPPRARLR